MRHLILTTVLLFCTAISYAQEKPINELKIGDSAPDFNLPATDDRNYSLSDFSEYPLLAILFTCNHCPTAQAYEDKIMQMVDQYRPQGVGFVAI
jgi:peroxiredoxin